MAYLAAALDIGSRSLKIALGKVGMKKTHVTDFEEIRYALDENGEAPPEEIERALGECAARLSQKVEAVYTAASGRDIFIRYIKIPKGGLKRIDQITTMQIEDDLPVEIENYVIEAVPLRESGDGKLVDCIVAAAGKEMLRGMIDRLAAAGLDPAEITCGPFIYPEAGALTSEPVVFEPIVVLDLGHASSELVVLEGGKPMLFRSILWGGKNITEKLRERFDVTFSHAESIKEEYGMLMPGDSIESGSMEDRILSACRESIKPFITDIRQSLMGYTARSGKYPQIIFLCGGTSRMRGMAEYITRSIDIRVQTAEESKGREPHLVRAKALLGETARTGAKRINFRKGELVFEGKANVARRRWIRAVAFAAALIVGWLIFSMAQISSLEKTTDKQHAELERITKEITGDEISDFHRAELMLKQTGTIKNPVPEEDAFDIIDTMSRKFPDTVVHDVEELDIRPDRWRIRGIVDSISDRDKIYEALIDYDECIKSISKGKTTLSVKDNRQKYIFDMETTCP